MTSSEFEIILDKMTLTLSINAQENTPCQDPKEFENIVLNALRQACQSKDTGINPSMHPYAFPDILVNGFGVEVKHTRKDIWQSVGNSIFEGMREKTAKSIYVVYGKMGGYPEVRWARYEDCISHVRISHAPRFVIEMERKASLFHTMNLAYSKFQEFSPHEKMKHVRQYARGRLREGERLWWLEDKEDSQHTLPIAVRIYRTLSDAEKRALRAEAALLCPEIVQGGYKRGKYDRAGLYLITQHGIFAPQMRDLFSAGSVGAKDGTRGHKYIVSALQDIELQMRFAAANLDSALFIEYWGEDCPPGERINYWLRKADKYAPDWMPSKELFKHHL